MNILQVGSYLYPDLVGGAEISAQNVYGHLAAAGHRVVRLRWAQGGSPLRSKLVHTSPGEWSVEAWRPYAPIEVGEKWQKPIFYGCEFWSRIDQSSLRRMLEQEKIDCVVIHSTRGMGYDFLRSISHKNIPTVIFLHDLALVCMNKSMVRNSSSCRNTCNQCRVVSEINAKSISKIKNVTLIGPSSQIVAKVKSILPVSGVEGKHIPNPNEYNIVARQRRHDGDAFVIGFAGRLEHDKGLSGLLPVIDSLASERNISFIVAGAGSLEEDVKSFVAERPWANFLGFVPPTEMPKFYDRVDCLVVPSLWPENFPGVVVQAITSGAPVVGFNTGGIPEIISHNATGFLVEPGDFEDLGKHIDILINNKSLFEEMSRSAISSSKRYSAEALGRQIVATIEETAA